MPALATLCPRPAVVCDEELLPFKEQSLNLVVSGFALHRVNDLPGALIQIRRALRPDGLFIAAALGSRSLHELREALIEAEAELMAGRARVSRPSPMCGSMARSSSAPASPCL